MFVIIKKQKHMEKTDSSPLSRQALYADKKQWNQFLSIFLLAVGVGFTVAGIIFFFAYNWEELPKFAKLGIVEVLLVASVLLATFTHWNKLVKQILLTEATFLIGTLFAVFGQIYQTGADAYDLFLGWTLFTILWAVAIRFAPLWLTFIGLLCTTIWLYNIQIASANSWEMTLLANAVTWICALTTIITEWMSVKGHLDRNNRWFVSLLSLATIIHTSFLLMMAICEENAILDVMRVNYRVPDLQGFYKVNAFIDETTVDLTCPLPGTEIHYTTGGSMPTRESALYDGALEVEETTDFAFRTFRPDGSPSDVVRTKYVKAPYAEAVTAPAALQSGLKAVWHDFRGNLCADIEAAPVKGEYVVESVSIPEEVKGNIGLVLTGYLEVPADGIYTFALLSDDGSTLMLDGELLGDNDGAHSPVEIIVQKALKAGLHPIEVRYFDCNGGVLQMELVNEKGEKEVLPSTWLKHE